MSLLLHVLIKDKYLSQLLVNIITIVNEAKRQTVSYLVMSVVPRADPGLILYMLQSEAWQ